MAVTDLTTRRPFIAAYDNDLTTKKYVDDVTNNVYTYRFLGYDQDQGSDDDWDQMKATSGLRVVKATISGYTFMERT